VGLHMSTRKHMHSYPAFLTLRGRECLVVGAGNRAAIYARALVENGALVTMISTDEINPAVDGLYKYEERTFRSEEAIDYWLVIAAGKVHSDNYMVAKACERHRTFCHQIDDPDSSTFRLPAVIDSSPLQDPAKECLAGNGFVSLVGAGPGDPELLTLRALRLIQSADVLVYDRLVSQDIMDLRRPDTQLLYAGKVKSDHSMPQGSINQLLVDLALEGKRVVRLKGGDPFIFGRGGEEIETLAKNRISFQIVPGITAASGCAAFAGIPLTHRDHAQSCVFVTGHLKNGTINMNWDQLNDPTQTIVIYMGLTGLKHICENLIRVGRATDTPAALVEQGTTPNQRTHVGTLQNLHALIESRSVKAPTLLIVGGVVNLHGTLQWFHPDPAAGSSESHFSDKHQNQTANTARNNDPLN